MDAQISSKVLVSVASVAMEATDRQILLSGMNIFAKHDAEMKVGGGRWKVNGAGESEERKCEHEEGPGREYKSVNDA